jgi:hypothetical protein
MNWVRHLTSDMGNYNLCTMGEEYAFPLTVRSTVTCLLNSETYEACHTLPIMSDRHDISEQLRKWRQIPLTIGIN